MLTKREVERTRSLVVHELDDYGDIAGLRKLSDQAIVAIDLDAENERLKAELAEYAETFSEQNKALSDHIIKLDAVSAECNKHIPANKIERLCLLDEYDIGQADLADNVLAIIDKDGEPK